MKHFLLVSIAISLNVDNTAIAQQESAPARTIETLWVSDQLAGMLGMWERKQSRFLISPTKIWTHYSRVQINDAANLEFNWDVSTVLNHWKNEHGGVIKLGPATGEFHTASKYFGDDPDDQPEVPEPTSEKFIEEGGPWFLAYRWLEEGKLEFGYPFHDDEDPKSKPVDSQKVLKALSSPEAFADLQFTDEDSLIPFPGVFSNFKTLNNLQTKLKKFSIDKPADYKAVAASLDKHSELPAKEEAPKRIQAGPFAGAHHFSNIFHEAMIDAGYDPYSGAFNFAAKQTEVGFGADEPDFSEKDAASLKMLRARFDPYRQIFEASLEDMLKDTIPPAELKALK